MLHYKMKGHVLDEKSGCVSFRDLRAIGFTVLRNIGDKCCKDWKTPMKRKGQDEEEGNGIFGDSLL